MLVIHEEINARENFEYLKQNDFDKKELNNQFTTSSLHAQIKVRKCVFCKNEDLYSDQGKIVTDVNSRREILSNGKCCFNCLKPGHIKKNCKAKVKCYRCRAEGTHHTALCFSNNGTPNTIDDKNNHPNTLNETEEAATCLVKNDTTILSQTASGCMDITNDHFYVVNVLLDTSTNVYIRSSCS